jgi:hypothetical protein
MTYFQAIEIKQDLIVAMQYADVTHQTVAESLKEAASKYTDEQFAEAYKVICTKMKEEKADLKQLLLLAAASRKVKI